MAKAILKIKGVYSSLTDKFTSYVATYMPPEKKKGWCGLYHFEHINAQGKILWKGSNYNNLSDEGELSVLEVYLRASSGAQPGTFYLRLYGDTPVDTDSMGSLTGEPAGSGYAAATVWRNTSGSGWPTMGLQSGDYRADSGTFSFTCNSGSWGPVTYAVLSSVGSGTNGLLVSYVALSGSRTLQNGDTLNVSIQVKLQ